MHTSYHASAGPAADTRRIFASIELSKAAWIVALQLPTTDKVSVVRVAGGDIGQLLAVLDRARDRVGHPAEIFTCYEAGYDGFWIHRALVARGVQNMVLDAASIHVSRRGKRVKTDRSDAESLLRILMALHRGERQVASVLRVPSVQEEDDKRLLRSRNNLLRERIRHTNRILGLLHLQGVRHITPGRRDWTAALIKLVTGDGRAFPPQLMREIKREARLLAAVQVMLREVDAEISGMVRDANKRKHPAQRGNQHPIAAKLTRLRGLGPQTAAVLATEVFYRSFRNRREVASYMGLTPTPYNSGSVEREQGISKAGNRRARTIAVELAWLWLRNQSDSSLSRWFHSRVGTAAGRLRRITIVALARKLIVALWRFVAADVVPDGAMVR